MATERARVGERRWPMAAAVLLAGVLRLFLPSRLRLDDAWPVALVVLAVLMVALIAGDPGRIDRQATWLRVLTAVRIGVITVANAGSSVRLVYAIIKTEPFTNDPNILLVSGEVIRLTNIIAFGLWYGISTVAARLPVCSEPVSHRRSCSPRRQTRTCPGGWYRSSVDYLHLSYSTSMAFSPTDVSAIKPWAKLDDDGRGDDY